MRKPLEYFNRKKNQLTYIFLFVFILLTISLACSLPFKILWTGSEDESQQETAQVGTAIAEAFTAEASRAGGESDQGGDGDEESTATAELPSETPSLTPSPTITETPTPEQVAAFISKNTNCRVGPKDVFELIHIFLKGDIVDMLGKNQDETFWYVQDQDEGSIQCWIWSEYATPEGLTENLPVFTPPPTPYPVLNYVASYRSTSGGTIVAVDVRNTGNIALQSYSATFKDTVTSESVAVASNKFGNADKVSVGNIGVVSSSPFSASTVGHQMIATIKACSNDGQTGKCVTVTINFESK